MERGFSQYFFSQLYSIYSVSFPKDERRSRQSLRKLLFGKKAKALLLADGRKLLGFAIFYLLSGFIFLEHLAVAKDARSNGLGTLLMNRLLKGHKKIVAELEPSTKSKTAGLRVAFYKKFGFKPINKRYVQPAYSKTKKPVKLWLFANFKPETEVVEKIYRKVYEK